MYNIVKGIILTVCVAVILSGCQISSMRVEKIINEYETDDESVYIETPIISGLSDKNFENDVNSQYQEIIESIHRDFLSDSQNSKNERDGKGKLELKHEVVYNKNNLISLLGECYKYTDGFNGTNIRIVKNIDTSTNTEILLSDLFGDDEYIQMLNNKLDKISDEAEYSDLWENPTITDAQNQYFYFTDEGIVIFYPPYELSYYARGFVEFTIPYAELYGYLKPEYSKLY